MTNLNALVHPRYNLNTRTRGVQRMHVTYRAERCPETDQRQYYAVMMDGTTGEIFVKGHYRATLREVYDDMIVFFENLD